MAAQTTGPVEANWSFMTPTNQTPLTNDERNATGGLLINLIEPIVIYNRRKWVAFWIGVPLGMIVFWYLIWNGTFLFADMRNWTLVLPYTFLAGGIGGWITWVIYNFRAGPAIRWKQDTLLELAGERHWARLLAHILDEHRENNRWNKRIRKVIEDTFTRVNET